MTTVVNIRTTDYDVRIDRKTKWGNPFVLGRDGDRWEVIARYRRWLPTQPKLMAALHELKDQRLGCHCFPLACHGDALADLANSLWPTYSQSMNKILRPVDHSSAFNPAESAAYGPDYVFFCEGCGCGHGVWTVKRNPNGPVWGFNNNMDAPTFTPSIKVTGTQPITDDEHARIMRGEKIEPRPLCCHLYVKNGMIEYLGDCTHALRGKTVPMTPF